MASWEMPQMGLHVFHHRRRKNRGRAPNGQQHKDMFPVLCGPYHILMRHLHGGRGRVRPGHSKCI